MIRPPGGAPFLATCALGFAGAGVPTGVWACPDPAWICAVAGGYAYLIDTRDPAQWEQLVYRPVTAVAAIAEQNLLVFSSFHSLLAWGREGKAWQTGRLSWDGVRITGVRGETLFGLGWDMQHRSGVGVRGQPEDRRASRRRLPVCRNLNPRRPARARGSAAAGRSFPPAGFILRLCSAITIPPGVSRESACWPMLTRVRS